MIPLFKIKIAIASNISFYKLSLPIIIPSLINSGIEPENIHVFIAGLQNYQLRLENKIAIHELDHNSYEYSPLIEIVEKQLVSDYWFLIHDTCQVGGSFKKLLFNIPTDLPEKLALKSFPSMSIGSYKYNYLLTCKEKLLLIKNKDYSYNSMNYWKQWGVPNEDYILWKTNPQPVIYNNLDSWSVVDNKNWFGTTTVRRTEYYPSLDIYKNKSNWGQSHIMVRDI